MSDETFERFVSFCQKHDYPKKSIIIEPGDDADILYYFIEGSAYVRIDELDGHEFILANLGRGDFIGDVGFFEPSSRQTKSSVYVQARSPCQLVGIRYSRLKELFAHELKNESQEILFTLGKHLSKRLLKTSRKAGHLAFLDVTGRIARTLIELSQEPEAMTHSEGMQISITRQDIGRMVGCSREMAGRVLKVMNQEGTISASGKTIVVKDAFLND
jgi:CRP/FNR family cyclic AMP-dependent transcriptional regulator